MSNLEMECRTAWVEGSTHGVLVMYQKVHCQREGFCISSQNLFYIMRHSSERLGFILAIFFFFFFFFVLLFFFFCL